MKTFYNPGARHKRVQKCSTVQKYLAIDKDIPTQLSAFCKSNCTVQTLYNTPCYNRVHTGKFE